jgi:cytochrome c-type biogenesis protein CcmE
MIARRAKPKRQRLVLLSMAVGAVLLAVLLGMSAMSSQAAFFYAPGDVQKQGVPLDRAVRIGGMVKQGSSNDRRGRSGGAVAGGGPVAASGGVGMGGGPPRQ